MRRWPRAGGGRRATSRLDRHELLPETTDTLESSTLYALQALLTESEKRYSTDRRRLYLAGMSGTAKTLWKVVEPCVEAWPE